MAVGERKHAIDDQKKPQFSNLFDDEPSQLTSLQTDDIPQGLSSRPRAVAEPVTVIEDPYFAMNKLFRKRRLDESNPS